MTVRTGGTLVFVLAAAVIQAQSAPAPTRAPAPCSSSEFRQFDFWIGDWDVANAKGKAAGRNRIESELGVTFSIVYGTTECSPLITEIRLHDAEADRCSTLGQPLPQTDVKIVDPATDECLPIGAVGELCARGYLVMGGYHDNPTATSDAIDGEGWYHTGDLAVWHEDGYIEVKDRSKDVIISGGENISSLEVEECLYRHPKVMEAAVVARPDEKWGETPCAFVLAKPGAGELTADEVIAWCREHLAGFKVPRKFVMLDALPLGAGGKLDRVALLQRLRATFA